MKHGFRDEWIIGMIKQYFGGMKTQDLCRKDGIRDATFHKSRAMEGAIGPSTAARTSL